MHVLESDDYRKEIAVLKEDEVLLGMAREVLEDSVLGHEILTSSSTFMILALGEYEARCKRFATKNNAKTVGGPGRAIKELIEEWSKSDGTD